MLVFQETVTFLRKRRTSEEVYERRRGHKKVPRLHQQVPGRKTLEGNGSKKEVQPTNNKLGNQSHEHRAERFVM
ncbi:hypothetical protein Trydic_g4222 [Trypoxylus dichotomus]